MDAPTASLETPTTLQAAIEFFSDADRCHAYMVQMRWPDGNVTCPTCNRSDVRYLANQRRFECRDKHPARQFSVKVGTIFEDSPDRAEILAAGRLADHQLQERHFVATSWRARSA